MQMIPIDFNTGLVIIHIFGVAVGAGGAYVSDLMFLASIQDEKITKKEVSFLRIASFMTWAGLFLLIVSGLGLFAQDIAKYSESTKFLSKMTIVLFLTINGIFFHLSHIPRLVRHVGEHFPSSDEFSRKRPYLLVSGAVSFVSWSFALVLGVLSGLPYTYWTIMIVYFVVIAFAVLGAYILERFVLQRGTDS